VAREPHPARLVFAALLACAGLAAGCSALPAEQEVPALISAPNTASRAQLERVISEALNGMPVTLADDALTRESTLTIERNRPRDAQGRPLDGRDPGRPEHFRLLKAGSDCVLLQDSTGRRWKLTASNCVAARR
jgi:hypothetical protein